MSVLSKVRKALNERSRPGESVKVTREALIDPADPGRGEVLQVELTCHRTGQHPPMRTRAVYRQQISERQCRFVQGGYPAVAEMLLGELRSTPLHPDHPQSVQHIVAGVAAATGMAPADVSAEVLAAIHEERRARALKVSGGSDSMKQTVATIVAELVRAAAGPGDLALLQPEPLPNTGKGFTVQADPTPEVP